MAYLDPPECSSTRGGNSVSKIDQKTIWSRFSH